MTPFDLPETDRLLTTTRAVRRRLDLDRPVPPHIIEEALEIAIQAPTAENHQHWRWVVVTDPLVRAAVADTFRLASQGGHRDMSRRSGRLRNSPEVRRLNDSVAALAETIARVPVLVLPCVLGRAPEPAAVDAEYHARNAHKPADDPCHEVTLGHTLASTFFGSIYPAIWSFQLALRSRGLGSTITCMHLAYAGRVARLLGIPDAITQICLLPVAYTIGTDFRPATRVPARQRTYWERWGATGYGHSEPLNGKVVQ